MGRHSDVVFSVYRYPDPLVGFKTDIINGLKIRTGWWWRNSSLIRQSDKENLVIRITFLKLFDDILGNIKMCIICASHKNQVRTGHLNGAFLLQAFKLCCKIVKSCRMECLFTVQCNPDSPIPFNLHKVVKLFDFQILVCP